MAKTGIYMECSDVFHDPDMVAWSDENEGFATADVETLQDDGWYPCPACFGGESV